MEDKKNRMKKLKLLSISAIVIFLMSGCGLLRNTPAKDDTIADIAYDVAKKFGYTVYLRENGVYEPYLVLTDDYEGEGNVLLLRQYLMDEKRQYDHGSDNYDDSLIDQYLNGEFMEMLSPCVRGLMADSTITITAPARLRPVNGEPGIDTVLNL